MTTTRKVGTMSAALLLACLTGCPPPKPKYGSLAKAIQSRTDEFPATSYVLVPPSDLDPLGDQIQDLGDRRARVIGKKCFDVKTRVGNGLTKLEISYSASTEMKAEIADVAASLGAEVKDDDQATMTLENLKVIHGMGIPKRGSGCGFQSGAKQTLTIVTAIVQAGSASLNFSRNFAASGQAKAGWGTGSGGVSAGTSTSMTGALRGKDIVVVGLVSEVEVELTTTVVDLGVTPSVGQVHEFPAGFDGRVTVSGFNNGEPATLIVTPHTSMGIAATLPKGATPCVVGAATTLTPGQGCFVWDDSAASGIEIWFRETDDDPKHVELHLDAYRTTFTENITPP